MAIEVAGRLYKKRSDAFYVNGRRVTDGWVNGVRVYPEDDGDYSYFIKLGGRVTGNVFNNTYLPELYSPVGTCECTVSIKSKRKLYLAVLNQYQPEISLGVYIENDDRSYEIPRGDVMIDVAYRLWCPDLVPKVHKYYVSNFPFGSLVYSAYPTSDTAAIISRLSTLSIHTGYTPITSVSEKSTTIYSSDAMHSISIGKNLNLWLVNGNVMPGSETVGGCSTSCMFGTYTLAGFSYDSDRDYHRTGLRVVANNLEYYYQAGEAEGPFTSDSKHRLSPAVLSPHLGTVMYGNLKRVYARDEYIQSAPFARITKMWEVEKGGSAQSVYPMSSVETSAVG